MMYRVIGFLMVLFLTMLSWPCEVLAEETPEVSDMIKCKTVDEYASALTPFLGVKSSFKEVVDDELRWQTSDFYKIFKDMRRERREQGKQETVEFIRCSHFNPDDFDHLRCCIGEIRDFIRYMEHFWPEVGLQTISLIDDAINAYSRLVDHHKKLAKVKTKKQFAKHVKVHYEYRKSYRVAMLELETCLLEHVMPNLSPKVWHSKKQHEAAINMCYAMTSFLKNVAGSDIDLLNEDQYTCRDGATPDYLKSLYVSSMLEVAKRETNPDSAVMIARPVEDADSAYQLFMNFIERNLVPDEALWTGLIKAYKRMRLALFELQHINAASSLMLDIKLREMEREKTNLMRRVYDISIAGSHFHTVTMDEVRWPKGFLPQIPPGITVTIHYGVYSGINYFLNPRKRQPDNNFFNCLISQEISGDEYAQARYACHRAAWKHFGFLDRQVKKVK